MSKNKLDRLVVNNGRGASDPTTGFGAGPIHQTSSHASKITEPVTNNIGGLDYGKQ